MTRTNVASLLIIALFAGPLWAGNPVPFQRTVGTEERWGYKDANDKVVIPAVFKLATDFSDRAIAAVIDSKGWACIDTQGKILVRPFIFDNGPDFFSEGLARFREDGRIGFFDEAGRKVIPAQFDFAWPFENGVARVGSGCREIKLPDEHTTVEGGVYATIDRTGKLLEPWR